MPVEMNDGEGAALDVDVAVVDGSTVSAGDPREAERLAAGAAEGRAAMVEDARDAVARAHTKVDAAHADLAGAEAAVAAAEAALADLEGSN